MSETAVTRCMLVRWDTTDNYYLNLMHHDGLSEGDAQARLTAIVSRWTKPHGQSFEIHRYDSPAERRAIIQRLNIQLI